VKVVRDQSRLYYLELHVDQPVCLSVRCTETAWLWHGRFGHLNFGALRRLATHDMARGLPTLDQVDQVCDGCLVKKQQRTPFLTQARRRAEHALDLVHGDLCGPIKPATPSGKSYFLLLVDDMSRFMWLKLLSSKDQAAAAIKDF
jgi:hypothetical protein